MKAKHNKTNRRRSTVKRLAIWALLVAVILMVPLTAKFPWTGGDYLLAGSVLFSAALGFELATKNTKDTNTRIIIAVATVGMVLFIWALAVAD